MKAYSYDESGAYLGEVECQRSPLEPGKFLMPSRATDKQPIVTAAGEVSVFEKGDWVKKPDHRGKDAYHKITKYKLKINYVGDLLPEHTLLAPEEYDVWVGDKWEKDTVKEQAQIKKEADKAKLKAADVELMQLPEIKAFLKDLKLYLGL